MNNLDVETFKKIVSVKALMEGLKIEIEEGEYILANVTLMSSEFGEGTITLDRAGNIDVREWRSSDGYYLSLVREMDARWFPESPFTVL